MLLARAGTGCASDRLLAQHDLELVELLRRNLLRSELASRRHTREKLDAAISMLLARQRATHANAQPAGQRPSRQLQVVVSEVTWSLCDDVNVAAGACVRARVCELRE